MYPHPPINGLQAFLAHSLALQKSQNRRSRRFCVFVFYLYPYGVPIQAERDICRCESQYGFNCRPAGLASNKALIIARAAGQTIKCWKHCCWSHPLVRTKAPAVTCHPVDLLPVGQYMRIMFALGWNTSLPCGQWWYFIFLPVSSLYFETVSTYWQFQGCVMGKTREGGRWKENRRRDVFDGDSRRWGNQKTQQSKSKDSKDTATKIKRHNNQNKKTQKTQQWKSKDSKDTTIKIKRHSNQNQKTQQYFVSLPFLLASPDLRWQLVEAIKSLARGNRWQSKASAANQGTLFRNCCAHTQMPPVRKTKAFRRIFHPFKSHLACVLPNWSSAAGER